MKVKYKLSIWIIAVMAFAITGISMFLLREVSGLSYYLSIRSLEHLTDLQTQFWKNREDGYISTLHTLANIMGDYESIQAAQRRDRYDDMLRSTLEAEPQMAALYTVWKPNAIDNMDSYYIGRTGSSQTGQYAMTYSRETDKIAGRTSYDIHNIMSHINGFNARKDHINNPSILKINGMDTFIIRMVVPIINHRTDEVVGGLGCFFVVNTIQHIMENTMKANDEIAVMAMYSSNGTILAHSMPDRVGKLVLDADVEFGDSVQTLYQAMQRGKLYMDTIYNPALNKNIVCIMKSFQIGNSDHNWSMLIGVPEAHVLKKVDSIKRLTVTLAVTTPLLLAAIIFVMFETIPRKKQQEVHVKEQSNGRNLPSRGDGNVNKNLPAKNATEKMLNGRCEVTKENRKPDQTTHESPVRVDDITATVEQINTTAAKIKEICLRNMKNIDFLTMESNWLKLTSQSDDSKKEYA